MLYSNLQPLPRDTKTGVLYRVSDYPHIASLVAIPVVLVEIGNIAREFPVVWQSMGDRLSLVALTGLAPGTGLSANRDITNEDISLLALKAYPFTVAPGDYAASRPVLVDHAEVRPGAQPINMYDSHGRFTRDALMRLAATRVFAHSQAKTARFSQLLHAAGLMQPWEFALQFGERTLSLAGLYTLTRDTQALYEKLTPLVEELGHEIVQLVEAHEISLFRMNDLARSFATISSAWTQIRAPAAGSADNAP
ncbi:SapC family protein [Pseudochelatococcus lubricantis]|uniref:SapC family protein n=1 Tax=Pseudochelatococcus lubricantis TaxID=1538102 RepID=UPI0035ECD4A2